MALCLNRISPPAPLTAFLQCFEWCRGGHGHRAGMMIPYPTPLLPRCGRCCAVTCCSCRPHRSPCARSSVPTCRAGAFDDRRRRGRRHPAGIDEEARFLAHMHRSRLEQDNDQLMLEYSMTSTAQYWTSCMSACVQTRCAELLSLQHWHPHAMQRCGRCARSFRGCGRAPPVRDAATGLQQPVRHCTARLRLRTGRAAARPSPGSGRLAGSPAAGLAQPPAPRELADPLQRCTCAGQHCAGVVLQLFSAGLVTGAGVHTGGQQDEAGACTGSRPATTRLHWPTSPTPARS